MENLKFLISKFEESFSETEILKREEKRKEFIRIFPIERLKGLQLKNYALGTGNKEDNLCWWLEYNTTELGGIKGGSAKKHKIYFSRKYDKWIYPKGFDSAEDSWKELRKELYEYIVEFGKKGYSTIDKNKMIDSMSLLRNKLLSIYYPEKVIPIFSLEDMKKALNYFEIDEEITSRFDINDANIELMNIKNNTNEFKSWNTVKFMTFLYKMIIRSSKYYKVSPGDDAMYWQECFENGYICIGWDEIGDLDSFLDYDEFRYRFKEVSSYTQSKETEKANEIWTFYSLKPGDIVVANKGVSKVLGVGEVTDKGYSFDEKRNEYKHTVGIRWIKDFKEKDIPKQSYWALKTVYKIDENFYKNHIEVNLEPTVTPNMEKTKENKAKIFMEDELKLFKKIDDNLIRKGNIILYGPPGTGKTYLSNRYIEWCSENYESETIKEFITFHPSFSYEDFIEGYKPNSENGKAVFTLEDGVFKSLCKEASKPQNSNKDYYILIDEINRGDVAKIFGEMITIIEKDKRGMEITLSQSKEKFNVPQNIYIIATMNTSDKSIKMMDAALRRRFAFIECMPNYNLINRNIDSLELSPSDILSKLNKELRNIEDREKQIGHSYMMKKGKQIETIQELKEVYIYEIIPLISEYCYNDYTKMKDIIGDKFIDEENEELKDELINGVDDYFANEIIKTFGGQND